MIIKRIALNSLTSIHLAGWVEVGIIEKKEDLSLLQSQENAEIIGGGSNILVKNTHKRLYKLSDSFNYIKLENNRIVCGAATGTKKIIRFIIEHGLSSIEFLSGLPATIGGCVRMNAGAFGKSIGEFIDYIEVFKNGKKVRLSASEIRFGYRDSSLSGSIILEVALKFKKDHPENVRLRVIDTIKRRLQRSHLSNTFGSVFKNPENSYAGKLIELAGLKGYKHNSASISRKHANFIIGTSQTNIDDILFLMDLAKERVFKEFGVELQEEVKII